MYIKDKNFKLSDAGLAIGDIVNVYLDASYVDANLKTGYGSGHNMYGYLIRTAKGYYMHLRTECTTSTFAARVYEWEFVISSSGAFQSSRHSDSTQTGGTTGTVPI